jgi:2-phospho-L-lactate guanylyltransferase
VLAVVPVKGFSSAKERLAAALEPARRRSLAAALAGRVAAAWRQAGHEVLVVAGDSEAAEWARARGLEWITEPRGAGLNGSATAGVQVALARGRQWCVAHADLPVFDGADAAAVVEVMGPDRLVLAPARDGGTNLIAGTGPFAFAYGPGSFGRHLHAARHCERVVVVRTGTALDLDAPADLAAAMALERGRWLCSLGWRP